MINDIKIGPLTIHMYGIMIALGIFVALFLSINRAKKKNMDSEVIWDLLYAIIFGGAIGGKLLYIIVEFKNILENPSILLDLSSGWVIYGAIIGGMLAVYWLCKRKNVDPLSYFDLLMPAVSLAQCFGRIGCFFAGCCYGRETDSWFSITYTISKLAPNNVKLIPTQLISSFGDFVFFVLLMMLDKQNKRKGRVFAGWLLLYSVGRFGIEFLRNDFRGNVGPFSTSQFVSLGIFIIGLFFWISSKKINSDLIIEQPDNEQKDLDQKVVNSD